MMVDIWGEEAFIAHCEMCAFKYRMRLGDKPYQSVEQDLEKARWYESKARELKATQVDVMRAIADFSRQQEKEKIVHKYSKDLEGKHIIGRDPI